MDNFIRKIYSLENKVAVITGASSGLGLSIARMMTGLGADVYGLSRSGPPVDLKKTGQVVNLQFRKLDVNVEGNIRSVFSEIVSEKGQMDILVNNAGVTQRKRAEKFTTEEWHRIMDINTTAVFNCCKYAYPYLKKSQGVGRIINITSMAAFLGFSEVVPYTASKSAVTGLTRGLAIEWAAENILVNSVSPGWFVSDMTRQIVDKTRKAKILKRIPLGRFAKAEEVAAMVCFLASPAGTYITGQDFSVDGGARAQGY